MRKEDKILYKNIKEEIIEEIRSDDPADDVEGLSLESINYCCAIVNRYFEDKIYDEEGE